MRVALEVLDGLAPFTRDEVASALPEAQIEAVEDTELRIRLDGDQVRRVLELRTVVAAYLVLDFPVRRPRGLLSPDHHATLLDAVTLARRAARPARFASFRLNAAGSDSDELVRLRREVALHSGLTDDPDHGDLLLRLRRPPATDTDTGVDAHPAPETVGPAGPAGGWQVLVRLTPRPLSARPWRVANYPGALNATLAAAVVAATSPVPTDRFADLMCGSGTLVIERLAAGPAARLVACDLAPEALDAARANQRAARLKGRVDYVQADARELSRHLASGSGGEESCAPGVEAGPSFNRMVVNLPWGELVGEHADNDHLYPAVLAEAGHMATDDAVLCALTQDIRRFDRAVDRDPGWAVDRTWRLFAKGHRPCLYRLVRTGGQRSPSSPTAS